MTMSLAWYATCLLADSAASERCAHLLEDMKLAASSSDAMSRSSKYCRSPSPDLRHALIVSMEITQRLRSRCSRSQVTCEISRTSHSDRARDRIDHAVIQGILRPKRGIGQPSIVSYLGDCDAHLCSFGVPFRGPESRMLSVHKVCCDAGERIRIVGGRRIVHCGSCSVDWRGQGYISCLVDRRVRRTGAAFRLWKLTPNVARVF